MMKLRSLGAAAILTLLAAVAALATVPTYTGFTPRSSGYIVTADEWNAEFQNLISFVNVQVIAPLNSLTSAKGNILSTDGNSLQVVTHNGATDDGKVLTLASSQTNGVQWNALVSGVTALTTKGDTLGFSTNLSRVPVGADGTVLTADSTNANGVSYQTSLPIGGIIMWSGSVATIPSGWYLCNGQTMPDGLVTPNLQGQFILGAGNTSPAGTGGFGLITPGTTGGAATHAHSVTVSGGQGTTLVTAGGSVSALYSGTLPLTGNTSAVSSAPSYYALCYIEKN